MRWPDRRAVSRARCIDRPASVATPSSQPVAIASAITPNASAFRRARRSTVITSVTALPATSAHALQDDTTRRRDDRGPALSERVTA